MMGWFSAPLTLPSSFSFTQTPHLRTMTDAGSADWLTKYPFSSEEERLLSMLAWHEGCT
jgi:hypothetical protein